LFAALFFLLGIALAGFVSEAFCPHLRALRYALLGARAVPFLLELLRVFSSNRTLLGLANSIGTGFAFTAACDETVVLSHFFRPGTRTSRPVAITLGRFLTVGALSNMGVIPGFIQIPGISFNNAILSAPRSLARLEEPTGTPRRI